MMVAAHSSDLAAAAACGLRTGHVARANEYGPGGAGETAPSLAVDIAAADLLDLWVFQDPIPIAWNLLASRIAP